MLASMSLSEAERIGEQLKRSVRGMAWHGPSLLEILQDVTADEALARPVAGTHTIAELVLHVTAWLQAVERGLDTGTTQLTATEDWPAVQQPFNWAGAVDALRDASKQLGARISRLPDDAFERTVRGSDQEYSTYVLLHGVVQHNLYHAGQLMLLKKALRSS